MKQFILLSLVFAAFAASSQGVVNVDKTDPTAIPNTLRYGLMYLTGGAPVPNTKYVQVVSGTPYFNDSLMLGKIVMSGGRVIDSLKLRLDLLENTFQYQGLDGTIMTATTPIRSITLFEPVAGGEYNFVHSDYMPVKPEEAGWYQVLAYGNVILYKQIVKKMTESKAYGSSITEQTIHTSNQYYILNNMVLTKIRKFKELPGLLPNRMNDLNNFISSSKLSGKSDADYAAVINYYNSLLAK
jgi:hypothetical protein